MLRLYVPKPTCIMASLETPELARLEAAVAAAEDVAADWLWCSMMLLVAKMEPLQVRPTGPIGGKPRLSNLEYGRRKRLMLCPYVL